MAFSIYSIDFPNEVWETVSRNPQAILGSVHEGLNVIGARLRLAMPAVPWDRPVPYGAPASVQSAGAVAAPMLAGFAFILATLDLTNSTRFRWPDATLLLLVLSGLSLIAAVQCGVWARYYDITPN